MMGFDFKVINGKTIHRVIFSNIAACARVVEEAYLAHDRKESVNPNSYFLRFPEKPSARIIALPAFLGNRFQVAGIKWIASFPENIRRGFPRASAVLILNDYQTGYPFACLESSIISAARTAASAAVAAEHMSPSGRRARRVGFVGNGLIARYIYDFLVGLGWTLDEVILYDLNREESVRFAREVCRPGLHREVNIAPDHETLLRASDLIVLATVAATPYIEAADALRHNPIVLNISLRDISPEIILQAQNVVDDVNHVLNANTSVHLAQQRTNDTQFIQGTLADLLLGRCKLADGAPRIFSPFGLGILDLAVGHWVHEVAVASGEYTGVNDFFFDMNR